MNKIGIVFLFAFVCLSTFAQEADVKEKEKALKSSTNLTWDGNKALSEDNFITAEVDYRKAIAKSPDNETYNEAFGRFKEAGEASTSKEEKHKAYHNMGNVFMKRKDYSKAVEAYKEALRNGPTDEETRYNLALAKELLKKDKEEKKQNQDDKDKDKEKKDQEKKDEGENEDKKDKGDEGEKGDEGDQNEEKKDENKEGEGDNKEDQKKNPEQGDNQQEQQQPRPNQLSKQQVENLLRAMQNAEKKVQDKIDAKKVKGAKIKNEKDW